MGLYRNEKDKDQADIDQMMEEARRRKEREQQVRREKNKRMIGDKKGNTKP